MQRKLFYIVLLFSFILLQACNNRGGSSYDEGDEHKIVFTLSTKNIETRAVPTRADNHSWNDNFDNNTDNDYETILGSSYDSRINDETVEVLIFDAATGDDWMDKFSLPKILQTKQWGKKGRSKHTNLRDEDTTYRNYE
jgi:hypothetical protein